MKKVLKTMYGEITITKENDVTDILKEKLKFLAYKCELTDRECERLIKAIDLIEDFKSELKLAYSVIHDDGNDYSDGWCDCIDGMMDFLDKGHRMIRNENEITDAIYRYSRAKETIKENCYVFNIGDLDESSRINKALDLACTAIDIIIGELEGERKE